MKSEPLIFHRFIEIANDELKIYLDESKKGSSRILRQKPAKSLAEVLEINQLIKQGGIGEEQFRALLRTYLKYSQRMHHPHYIGHQVSVSHLISGVADFVHGAINNPMAIYEMGPSASVIEKCMVNWMLSKVGWFQGEDYSDFSQEIKGGSGVFTHGGSMANLTALLAARAKKHPDSWEQGVKPQMVVVAPETSHYSIARAVSIIGLGKHNLVQVKVDELERMIPEELDKKIRQLNKENKSIIAVIANACATTTGLYDPLDAIADVCERYKLWFHVDAAHGGSALLSPEEKTKMKGVHRADSMIWDTHKMLRTSTLSAAVLFKRSEDLIHTFQQNGSYLFHEKENPGFDLMPYTIECTKAPLATKLYWVLAAEGELGLRDFVKGQYEKTRSFYELIDNDERFECPYFPESNILCFRYIHRSLSNEKQLQLRNRLVYMGNFYITSAIFQEKRYLRLTVMNPSTEKEHILALLEEIHQLACDIE